MITFKIINQSERKPCFVGTGSMSTAVHAIVSQQHNCEIATVEDLMSKNDQWFNEHSFIVISSDIKFKMRTVDYLDSKNASYFSIVNEFNNINGNVKVGEGTCIFCFNDMIMGPVTIGRHCVIGSYNIFCHGVNIGDFCHVGHHGFFSEAIVGKGNVFGIGISLVENINIVDFCNFITGSVITKNISIPGTYHGNRRLNPHTSLTKRIL